MKKLIILSFIFLFFAGINNNANAQKEPPQTLVIITYVWHCTHQPNANLYVHFKGYDTDNKYQTSNRTLTVGSNPTKTVGTAVPWICYKSVTVDIDVRGDFAWASKTVTKSQSPYVDRIYVTLDIYDEIPQNPGW